MGVGLFVGGELDFTLASTGTHEVFLDPYNAGVPGTVTVTLSADVAGTISSGGASVPVSLNRAGQNGRFTFSGAAGQQLGLGVSSVSGFSTGMEIRVRRPDGSTLRWGASSNSGKELDFTLDSTGTHTVFLDPMNTNTGSATLTLSEDIAGSIAIGGASESVTIPRIGQNGRFAFTGTAGQRLGVGLSGVTIACCGLRVWVLKPDGSSLKESVQGSSGGEFDVPALPVDGTYTIFVDPESPATGSVTVTLSEDVPGFITAGAASVTAAMARIGQNGRISFQGATGQQLRLSFSGVTVGTSPCCGLDVWVRDPDGSLVTQILVVPTAAPGTSAISRWTGRTRSCSIRRG